MLEFYAAKREREKAERDAILREARESYENGKTDLY